MRVRSVVRFRAFPKYFHIGDCTTQPSCYTSLLPVPIRNPFFRTGAPLVRNPCPWKGRSTTDPPRQLSRSDPPVHVGSLGCTTHSATGHSLSAGTRSPSYGFCSFVGDLELPPRGLLPLLLLVTNWEEAFRRRRGRR